MFAEAESVTDHLKGITCLIYHLSICNLNVINNTGVRLRHDADDFKEGESVILTLADKRILDEGGDEDELENVNKAEQEKRYVCLSPYDDDDDDDDDDYCYCCRYHCYYRIIVTIESFSCC